MSEWLDVKSTLVGPDEYIVRGTRASDGVRFATYVLSTTNECLELALDLWVGAPQKPATKTIEDYLKSKEYIAYENKVNNR